MRISEQQVVQKSRFSGKVVCDVKLEGQVAVMGVRPNAKPESLMKKEAEIISFQVNPAKRPCAWSAASRPRPASI